MDIPSLPAKAAAGFTLNQRTLSSGNANNLMSAL